MNQKTIIASVAGVIIIGIAVIFFGFKDDDTLAVSDQSYAVTNVATNPSTNSSTKTYTAAITYRVPSPEQNSITVNLTVTDGVITAADVNNIANSPESKQYSSRFMSSYKTVVVGQKLSDISLTRVGGASLTSNAFNAAVNAIKTQVG